MGGKVKGPVTEVYPGRHEPIIDRGLWDRVHEKMKRVERDTTATWTHTHLLKGKLRTWEDHAMSPGSVQQTLASGEQRRVPYYTSQKALKQGYRSCAIRSINAKHMDDLVRGLVLDHLRRGHGVELGAFEPGERDRRVRDAVHRVVVAPDALTIELVDERVAALVAESKASPSKPKHKAAVGRAIPTCPFTPTLERRGGVTVLSLRIQIKRHDGRRILLSPDGQDLLLTMTGEGRPLPNPYLAGTIGHAFALHAELLRTGGTIERIAKRFGHSDGWARVLLDLTKLGPGILKAILTGTLPPTVTLKDLHHASKHLDWSLQEATLRG